MLISVSLWSKVCWVLSSFTFTDSEYLKNRDLQLEDGYDKQAPVGMWQFDTCDTLAATDPQEYSSLCSGMYIFGITIAVKPFC